MVDISVNASLLTAQYARATNSSAESSRFVRNLNQADTESRAVEFSDERSLPVDKVEVTASNIDSLGQLEGSGAKNDPIPATEEDLTGVGRREQPIPSRNIPLGSTVDLIV